MSRYRYYEIECDFECDFEGCDRSVTERLERDAVQVARDIGWSLGKQDYCSDHRKPRRVAQRTGKP
jgi:hypothetical protein